MFEGLVETRWGLRVERVEVLVGGMNSRVWMVVAGGKKYVVKAVGVRDDAFAAGLEMAARLQAGGVVTGAPVASRSGRLVEVDGEHQVAVLEFVDGVPLVGGPEDHAVMGATIARVHAILAAEPADIGGWVDRMTGVFDEYLDLEPWIRPAVEGALDGVRKTAGLSWAGLHGDPAAEAFLRQPDGATALIDWGGAMLGPVLYDLGSLVMYLSEPDRVIAAYLAERPALTEEVSTHLDTFINFRFAIQAAYFAWRLATDVQTGLTTSDGNHKGLSDARRWFNV
ncbi:phosphotransferase [Kribbella sp. NPDC006257]|uniref:phosphotransferase enzyme family protein n=1 Tax=Kribbella sp. NPDC006257 TaxID=3156738 RepID=UPI0033A574E5